MPTKEIEALRPSRRSIKANKVPSLINTRVLDLFTETLKIIMMSVLDQKKQA